MTDRFAVMCSQLAGEPLPPRGGPVLRTVRHLGAGAVALDDLIAKVFGEEDQEDAPARPARRTVFDRAGLIAPDIPKRPDRRRKPAPPAEKVPTPEKRPRGRPSTKGQRNDTSPATQAPSRYRKAPALPAAPAGHLAVQSRP